MVIRPGNTTGARVLLIGPQVSKLTLDQLFHLQQCLKNDSRLEYLTGALSGLPNLGPILRQVGVEDEISESLEALRKFALGEQILEVKDLTNSQLSPLTVASQVLDWEFRRDTGNICLGSDDDNIIAAQGLCMGFLLAAVLSTAKNQDEFQQLVANSIRLATSIGAVVDSDVLGCKTEASFETVTMRCREASDKAHLNACLDLFPEAYISSIGDVGSFTITIPSRDLESFLSHLQTANIKFTTLGFNGRYHHPGHKGAADKLKSLCAEFDELKLEATGSLQLPLRSTIDAELVTDGHLHDIAIESILCKKAHWFQTVKHTIFNLTVDPIFELVGPESCVPQTLSSPKAKLSGSFVTNHGGPPSNDVAIVGLSCRLPGSESPEGLWSLLESGKTAVTKIPPRRFNEHHTCREPVMDFWGGFIQHPDQFDHRFFNISGREAKSMDPQQRLALQVTYEALELAGYCGQSPEKRDLDVGCYLGVGAVDYETNVTSESANAFSATGTLRAFVSGRVSHFFGWTGPSMTFDTACSSSAVAIHTACKAILNGECSMAVSGGVNVITSPFLYQNLSAASFLNPNGPSRAFDASASGYCRGEGAGILVLKSLSRAVADGDNVLAVISGSAINQSPNMGCSITIPSSQAQSSLYKKALSESGVDADDITYVEAHGTGTIVGDPIEYESVRLTFSKSQRNQDLILGSLKDNIGHTEAASGVAAVIKTVLMMQHGIIPKQPNFETLNPHINSSISDHICVPKSNKKWTSPRGLIALVNNYGAAGSNVSMVIREHTKNSALACQWNRLADFYPIVLSAKSETSLQQYMHELKCYLGVTGARLGDIANELGRRQNPSFHHRVSFVANEKTTLVDMLQRRKDGGPKASLSTTDKRTVLMFGGQTGRNVTIRKEVYDSCGSIRFHLDQCDSICKTLGLSSIFPAIFEGHPMDDLVQLHCMLLALQVSSAKSWLDTGLSADTLIGHSFGQISALCVAGSIDLKDAFRFVSARARLIRDSWGPEHGEMLAVECSQDDMGTLLRRLESFCEYPAEIACYNGHHNFVIAGSVATISKAQEHIHDNYPSFKTTKLQNTHAYHSYLTESILDELQTLARTIKVQPPRIYVETCSPHFTWDRYSPEALVGHTRQPVYFSSAVERIANRLPSAIWLEAGSGTPIIAMTRRILSKKRSHDIFVPLNLQGPGAFESLAGATCQLWSAGSQYHSWQAHAPSSSAMLDLPLYQFEKSTHWLDYRSRPTPTSSIPLSHTSGAVFLVNFDAITEYLFAVNTSDASYQLALKGHVVADQELCPPSLYLALAARCAFMISPDQPSASTLPHFSNVVFSVPLTSNASSGVFMQLQKVNSRAFDFTLYSSPVSQVQSEFQESSKIRHGNGRLTMPEHNDAIAEASWTLLQRIAPKSPGFWLEGAPQATSLHGKDIYRLFSNVVSYARYYQGVNTISALDYDAVGTVTLSNTQQRFGLHDNNAFDPVAVDNFLQIAGIHVNCLANAKDADVFICTGVDDIIFGPSAGAQKSGSNRSWVVCSRYEALRNKTIKNDIFVYDALSMKLVATIIGANFRSIPFTALSKQLNQPAVSNEYNKKAVASSSGDSLTTDDGLADRGICFDSMAETAQKAFAVINTERQPNSVNNVSGVMQNLRELLSGIIEIPIADITPKTTLVNIGIDSLLVTEVIDEIKRKFHVILSQIRVLGCVDILELSQCIHPESTHDDIPILDEPNAKSPSNATKDRQYPRYSQDTQPILMQSHKQEHEHGVATISRDCFSHATTMFDKYAQATKFAGFYDNCFHTQSKLAMSYILSAFAKLGCDLRTLRPGQTVPNCPHREQHKKLIARIYRILEDYGIISEKEDGTYELTSASISSMSENTLMTEMIQYFPQHASETRLLHSTGSRLAECLSGDADPLSILFKDPLARDLLQDVYANAPMFSTGSKVLQSFICSIVSKLGNSNREIRILEVGAGTGATTRSLVEMLGPLVAQGTKISYTFTDISPSFVASARHKFSRFPFMRYTVLDIEKAPEQTFEGNFDVVIATNCIHATRDLVNSTRNIHKLLQSDGLLCLLELTRALPWFDLVFGLLDGWWLFSDDRKYVLADEGLWDSSLRKAGFGWVAWTDSPSRESDLLRLIVATRCELPQTHENHHFRKFASTNVQLAQHQTLVYKSVAGLDLLVDLYYPPTLCSMERTLPIALMIHGGGHIMLSRDDVNPQQVKTLQKSGFLPVSVDYRLCPEVTLLDGPMADVADALAWIRDVLPVVNLSRRDIKVDTTRIVAIGWSTGGHLAMSLGWTSIPRGIRPPEAVLAFYCPTDYEDKFWTEPNYPAGVDTSMSKDLEENIVASGVKHAPITQYKLERCQPAKGGWMFADNARSRLALYMNTEGRTLNVLTKVLSPDHPKIEPSSPNPAEIMALSPLAQIRLGNYKTPTFIIHPRQDDLIPWQQAQRTWEALCYQEIDTELRILEDVPHLFDIHPEWSKNEAAQNAVDDAFQFLKRHANL